MTVNFNSINSMKEKKDFDVELEEEDTAIPTGPAGTAGVDTMNDDGLTHDGRQTADEQEDIDDEEETGGALDEAADDLLGEDDETTEESSPLRRVASRLLDRG